MDSKLWLPIPNGDVAVSNPDFVLIVFLTKVVFYHPIFSALLVNFFVCAVKFNILVNREAEEKIGSFTYDCQSSNWRLLQGCTNV